MHREVGKARLSLLKHLNSSKCKAVIFHSAAEYIFLLCFPGYTGTSLFEPEGLILFWMLSLSRVLKDIFAGYVTSRNGSFDCIPTD